MLAHVGDVHVALLGDRRAAHAGADADEARGRWARRRTDRGAARCPGTARRCRSSRSAGSSWWTPCDGGLEDRIRTTRRASTSASRREMRVSTCMTGLADGQEGVDGRHGRRPGCRQAHRAALVLRGVIGSCGSRLYRGAAARLCRMNSAPNVHSAAYWLCARHRSRSPSAIASPAAGDFLDMIELARTCAPRIGARRRSRTCTGPDRASQTARWTSGGM